MPDYTPKYLAGGVLDERDPGNIARYYELMGGGGGSQRDVIAQAMMAQAAPPPQQIPGMAMGGGGWTPAYLPGGQLNQNDPGNIAEYYRIMGMGQNYGSGPGGGGEGMGGTGGFGGGYGPSVGNSNVGNSNVGNSNVGNSNVGNPSVGFGQGANNGLGLANTAPSSGIVGPTDTAFGFNPGMLGAPAGFGNPNGFDPSPGLIGLSALNPQLSMEALNAMNMMGYDSSGNGLGGNVGGPGGLGGDGMGGGYGFGIGPGPGGENSVGPNGEAGPY